MNEEEFTNQPRGVQVWHDVVRRKPATWLALDDDHVDWPSWCLDNYVQSHETEGISEPSVTAELIQKLRQFTVYQVSPQTDISRAPVCVPATS